MLPKEIEYEGNTYYVSGRIKVESTIYVEYRNDKIQKLKFFEYKDGKLDKVKDKEKLQKAILKKYEIFDGTIE